MTPSADPPPILKRCGYHPNCETATMEMHDDHAIIIVTISGTQIICTVDDERQESLIIRDPRRLIMMDPSHIAITAYMPSPAHLFEIQMHAVESIGTVVPIELEKAYKANVAGLLPVHAHASVILHGRN